MKKFFTYSDCVVPAHHPRVLVETAVAQGASRESLLANTGIGEGMLDNPETRISYLQYAVLVRNALMLTGNPALGLDVGQNLRFPQMGMVGLAIMSSATVGAALETAIRHNRMLAPAFELSIRVAGERARLTVAETIPLGAFATEVLLAAFETQGRMLAGHALPVRELKLAYGKPAHAARYADFFDGPTLWDQEVTEVEFDASLLAEPVAFADPATARMADAYCSQQYVLPEQSLEGLVAQVRRLLQQARGRPPDLESVARALQTSTRSLRRSLQDMGASYLELLDETRRTRAEEWVRSTQMTFEQIGEQLGFSNVRSFRRAFKRWTGLTPGAFRALREQRSA